VKAIVKDCKGFGFICRCCLKQSDRSMEVNGKIDAATIEKLRLNEVKIGDGEYFGYTGEGCQPITERILSLMEEFCEILGEPDDDYSSR